MRRLLRGRLGLAVAVGVLVVGCATAVPDAPDPDAGAPGGPLTVGDCTQAVSEEAQLDEVTTVSCTDRHHWEVYAATSLEAGPYPGDAATQQQAEEFCGNAYEAFVGTEFAQSNYEMLTLYPSAASWTTDDDRGVVCLIGSRAGDVTGTLRDAER